MKRFSHILLFNPPKKYSLYPTKHKILSDTIVVVFESVWEFFFYTPPWHCNAFLKFSSPLCWGSAFWKWNCAATSRKVVMEAFFLGGGFSGSLNRWIEPPPPNELTLNKGVSFSESRKMHDVSIFCGMTRCSGVRFIYALRGFVSFNLYQTGVGEGKKNQFYLWGSYEINEKGGIFVTVINSSRVQCSAFCYSILPEVKGLMYWERMLIILGEKKHQYNYIFFIINYI